MHANDTLTKLDLNALFSCLSRMTEWGVKIIFDCTLFGIWFGCQIIISIIITWKKSLIAKIWVDIPWPYFKLIRILLQFVLKVKIIKINASLYLFRKKKYYN